MNREIRESFPAARLGTYLNSAAIGPLSSATVKAVTTQLDDVANNGSANICEWLATKQRVRAMVASMLGAAAGDVAFTRNTSDGLCAVAAGVKWTPGDNIVSFANEFPANYYPWRTVRDRHWVELRLCREVDGRIDLEELLSLIDHNTRIVAVSAVQCSIRPDSGSILSGSAGSHACTMRYLPLILFRLSGRCRSIFRHSTSILRPGPVTNGFAHLRAAGSFT